MMHAPFDDCDFHFSLGPACRRLINARARLMLPSQAFLHPLSGLDHLTAMLALGFWAGVLGGSALWHGP